MPTTNTVASQAISTIGVKLSYSATATGTYTQLYSISRVPELEGSPEQVDVTPLSSDSRIYVPGVKDNQELEFEGWMGKWGADSANLVNEFAALRALDPSTAMFWQLDYPDGSKQTFSGYPSARVAGSEVNGGQGYILAITPASSITYTPPAT